ncbi:MAG: DUF418 domain-containing protein [Telluria sp.]
MAAPSSTRSVRIDAVRGLAVFGILLINAWGFVYGYTGLRYGVMMDTAGAMDRLAVMFSAAFAEQKFYPVFAFLFGAGYALQMQSLERAHGPDEAKRIYRRRLKWLLAVGILHGTLLWFGDILTAYALTGFWLLAVDTNRGRGLAGALKVVIGVHVFLLLLTAAFIVVVASMDDHDTAASALRAHQVYTGGSYGEVALARLKDFGANAAGFWLFLPRLVLLFMGGVFAVRLGWLTDPGAHRRLWRRVLLAGLLVALPLNLWWGYAALSLALDPVTRSAAVHVPAILLEVSGPALGAAYVAAFMLAGQRPLGAVAAWLAPVGRMALTNYLMQSIVCGLLLHAYGLGLGAAVSRAQLLGVAGAVMLFQLLLSRWWMARFAQGPVEALWRRFTYRS